VAVGADFEQIERPPNSAALELGPRRNPSPENNFRKAYWAVRFFDLNQTVTMGLSSDCHENGRLHLMARLNLLVPNISDRPAHLLGAERTICDG
jgi:hypothetical protein